MQIAFSAESEVSAAIARIGRTEDVHFSLSGSRVALAGIVENRLLIIATEADLDSSPPQVRLTDFLELSSADFKHPHGVFWVDEHTLAVANRQGAVALFELPTAWPVTRRLSLPAIQAIDVADLVKTPGSISVSPVGLGLVELLACNNYVNHVSRLLLDRRDNYAVIASEVLLAEGLKVPDGVARSPSGRWIAVSNHDHRCVFLFRNDGALNPESGPSGVLRGIRYPHGLRFAQDETTLLVADAGAPLVHLFRSEDRDWTGEREPATSVRVLSDEAFERGRSNPQEGGPKGIDLMGTTGLMAVSCEEQPLAFFDVRALLGPAEAVPAPSDAAEAERVREALIGYLSSARRGVQQAAETFRRASEWESREVFESRSWRFTAPLRRMGSTLRRLTGRSRR